MRRRDKIVVVLAALLGMMACMMIVLAGMAYVSKTVLQAVAVLWWLASTQPYYLLEGANNELFAHHYL